ncbi:Maf-like protein [Iodidimonas gelatinilytica]|uniref:dTTP/UTP pyrophosphatase n=1 Tax=Iodidimonas gelatinilytica TaxID=1236966 RepID=A0A5A7MNS8_9PROT|nr:Maf-like protein [Iodidimonas gelatinilytica]
MILASASPRRVALLDQIGVHPDAVVPADIDEQVHKAEQPRPYARRMAFEKARHVAKDHPDCFILAADTVVSVGRRILPKALDRQTADDCLAILSGRRHRVTCGVALVCPDGRCLERQVDTVVIFKRLSADERRAYLDSGDWHGKAGGYALQGYAAAFVRRISGSYSTVVGLPLFDVSQMLQGQGYPLLKGWACSDG